MKKQLQFELWQECNSKCDFCYLNGVSVEQSKNFKLFRIKETLDIINDLSIYDEYDTISLIGGEFFQGQISDPEVNAAFFKLIERIAELHNDGYVKNVWIMVSLLIGKQPDLYKTFSILGDSPDIWANTSYDTIGRFKSLKMLSTWENHMWKLHEDFPNVHLNTTMVLTEDLIVKYLKDEFSFRDFASKYNTTIYLKPPSLSLIECETVESHLKARKLFNERINGFFPSRDTFRKFLFKYHAQESERDYGTLFNIKLRADSVARLGTDGHSERVITRLKSEKSAGDLGSKVLSCGHSNYYAVYGDSDACMLCDKITIGEL